MENENGRTVDWKRMSLICGVIVAVVTVLNLVGPSVRDAFGIASLSKHESDIERIEGRLKRTHKIVACIYWEIPPERCGVEPREPAREMPF